MQIDIPTLLPTLLTGGVTIGLFIATLAVQRIRIRAEARQRDKESTQRLLHEKAEQLLAAAQTWYDIANSTMAAAITGVGGKDLDVLFAKALETAPLMKMLESFYFPFLQSLNLSALQISRDTNTAWKAYRKTSSDPKALAKLVETTEECGSRLRSLFEELSSLDLYEEHVKWKRMMRQTGKA